MYFRHNSWLPAWRSWRCWTCLELSWKVGKLGDVSLVETARCRCLQNAVASQRGQGIRWKRSRRRRNLTKCSSSEEDGLERSWSERGWGDLSQRFHQAGWLIKEEQGSWHKSVQAWRRARGTDGRAGEAEKREELKKLWYSGNVPSGGLQGWGRNMRGPRGLSRRTSSTSRTEQTWRRRWCWRQTKCGWPSQSDHTKSPTLDVTEAGGEPQVALRGLKKEIRACFSLEKPWKWSTRKNPKLRQVHEQRGDVLSRKPKIDKILKSWVVNEFLEVVCWEIEMWFTCGSGKWSRLIRSFQVSTLQNLDAPAYAVYATTASSRNSRYARDACWLESSSWGWNCWVDWSAVPSQWRWRFLLMAYHRIPALRLHLRWAELHQTPETSAHCENPCSIVTQTH